MARPGLGCAELVRVRPVAVHRLQGRVPQVAHILEHGGRGGPVDFQELRFARRVAEDQGAAGAANQRLVFAARVPDDQLGVAGILQATASLRQLVVGLNHRIDAGLERAGAVHQVAAGQVAHPHAGHEAEAVDNRACGVHDGSGRRRAAVGPHGAPANTRSLPARPQVRWNQNGPSWGLTV